MRSRVILLGLFIAAMPFSSCKQQKKAPVNQEMVEKTTLEETARSEAPKNQPTAENPAVKKSPEAPPKAARRVAGTDRFVELGVTVKPTITKIKLTFLGRIEKFRGVEVVSVEPDSVAEKAGLKEGDLIEGICGRPIYHLDNVVDGLLRALPRLAGTEKKPWAAALVEGDAITRPPQFSIIRNEAQMDLDFDADTACVNRANFVMAVTRYGNTFAERTDILGGLLLCEKRARQFKSFALLGPVFEVKDYGPWKRVSLLGIMRWRQGDMGDVTF